MSPRRIASLAPVSSPATRDGAITVAVAAALTLLVFVTTGGDTLGPNTWTEIALVVAGVGVGVALLLRGATGGRTATDSRRATVAVALFGAFAGFTALSIAWSVNPNQSWIEAGRTAAYFAAFGGALGMARLVPARWPALLGGVALAAVVVSGAAVLVKVFAWSLDGQPQLGRLLAPFGYWNATGLAAALGLPPLVWAASRRERGVALRALAVPAIALLITVVVLSYSRSALAAAVIGTAIPLARSGTRLRAALMVGLAAIGAAIVCGATLGNGSLTDDTVTHAARVSADHSFGLLLAIVLVALAGAGVLAARQTDRAQLTAAQRRRIGIALLVVVALVPIAGLGHLATSSRGFGGEISHIWTSLTSSSGSVGDSPNRLVDLANTRPRYWHEGLIVGEHNLLAGAGAGGFATAFLRYGTSTLTPVGHAHSYLIQTFADLGLIGVALTLALLLAWGWAAARGLSRRPSAGPAQDPEPDGLWAMLGVVVAFGVSSAVDWTWFYPGVCVPALVCAGWMAGAGRRTPATLPGAARRPLSARPGAILALTGIVALAIAAAWAIWQPLRSTEALNAGLTAIVHRDPSAAIADTRAAAAEDPVAIEPYQQLAAIYEGLNEPANALAALVQATRIQPKNPVTWEWLGPYELTIHRPRAGLRDLRRAIRLDDTDLVTPDQIGAAEIQVLRLRGHRS